MATQNHRLHIFFFPFLAHGHMIPTVDMAKLFAARGVRSTIITTPLNLPLISKSIEKPKTLGHAVNIRTIKFPYVDAGLPEGCEIIDAIPSLSLFPNFFKATMMLQEPLEQILQEDHPDCLIADSFFPWATDSADKFGIPRIVFQATGSFPLCASQCVELYQPHKNVLSDSESFVIPNLPGKEIKMTRMVLPDHVKSDDTPLSRLFNVDIEESEARSFGVAVNSFYELEQIYADQYQKVHGRKSWHIGPLSLCNRYIEEKAYRGKQASIDEQECLKWLDSKKPSSVLYVCFGSISDFPECQLTEIAMALEASCKNFIWVVRKKGKEEKEEDEWLPKDFEKRMEGKGLIIRGWAPQALILDHEAIGGFVTHCGWNSTLEGVCGGVPMVTWPLNADQFYNEKFVTEVLRIGVPVGAKKFAVMEGDSVKNEAIVKAVKAIMEGEEAEEMRNRARRLAKMAKEAVEEGGSSYSHLNSLIEELSGLSNSTS